MLGIFGFYKYIFVLFMNAKFYLLILWLTLRPTCQSKISICFIPRCPNFLKKSQVRPKLMIVT